MERVDLETISHAFDAILKPDLPFPADSYILQCACVRTGETVLGSIELKVLEPFRGQLIRLPELVRSADTAK